MTTTIKIQYYMKSSSLSLLLCRPRSLPLLLPLRSALFFLLIFPCKTTLVKDPLPIYLVLPLSICVLHYKVLPRSLFEILLTLLRRSFDLSLLTALIQGVLKFHLFFSSPLRFFLKILLPLTFARILLSHLPQTHLQPTRPLTFLVRVIHPLHCCLVGL